MTKSEVLRALKVREGQSATAVAKALGKTKASEELKSYLEELVEDGTAIFDETGKYPVYFKAAAAPVAELTHDEDIEIPSDTMGYEIRKGKDGCFTVTSPKGRKYKLEEDERLLIINPGKTNEKPYAVITPERAFDAITDYVTKVEQIVNYVVQDIRTGKYVDPRKKDIDMSCAIIFVAVRAHNKAGK